MRTRLMLALEEETPAVVDDTTGQELLDSTTEVEEAHTEVTEAVGEVTELTEAVDQGAVATDELAAVGEVLAEKASDGEGMSEDAAAIATVAIESIRERIGMKRKSGVPSLETFKTPRARAEATRIALEAGVMDTLKAIWQKIVEICKAIWNKIKEYFAKLFKNYDGLKAHLERLKAKAEALTTETEGKTLEKPGLAKFFTRGGKADFSTAMATLKTAGELDEVVKKTTGFVNSRADLSKLKEGTEDSVGGATLKDLKELETAVKDAVGKVGKVKDGMYGPLPGFMFLKCEAKNDAIEVSFEEGKDPAKELANLSKKEIVELLDAAIGQVDQGKKIRDEAANAEAAIKALTKASEAMVSSIAKTEKDEKKAASIRAGAKVASAYIKVVAMVNTKIPQAHFGAIRYSGDYAAAAISSFKKEEKKSKDDGKDKK